MKAKLRLIGGKKLESPISDKTRPTTLIVREAIFNILSKNVENSYWLDLFSGSGVISCEAYNHGAKKIVAIEKDKSTVEICKKNIYSLEDTAERKNDIKVIHDDVFSWINKKTLRSDVKNSSKQENYQFDYIYVDPPYKNKFQDLLLDKIFNSNFIKNNTLVIYETSKFNKINNNSLWQIKDIRSYGQTLLTFLIKV